MGFGAGVGVVLDCKLVENDFDVDGELKAFKKLCLEENCDEAEVVTVVVEIGDREESWVDCEDGFELV